MKPTRLPFGFVSLEAVMGSSGVLEPSVTICGTVLLLVSSSWWSLPWFGPSLELEAISAKRCQSSAEARCHGGFICAGGYGGAMTFPLTPQQRRPADARREGQIYALDHLTRRCMGPDVRGGWEPHRTKMLARFEVQSGLNRWRFFLSPERGQVSQCVVGWGVLDERAISMERTCSARGRAAGSAGYTGCVGGGTGVVIRAGP